MNLDEFIRAEGNRREFLGSSAKNAAGMAAGVVGLSGSVARASSPNDRVSVGVIGVRGQGRLLATGLAGLPEAAVTAVCDIDESVLQTAASEVAGIQGSAPRRERDFRRLLDDRSLDAVVIATPDHWHAPMTILACQAGKDVYVEKPVSLTLAEGGEMLAAAARHSTIVQCGLQQRSGAHFQSAVELIRSGKLGRVRLAKAWTVHSRRSIGKKKDVPCPEGVDYDLWLGPAPAQAFNPNRFHYNWRWFWDYGTGELGNWGVHLLDVARWGLNVDWPNRVSATGGKFHFNDDQQTPDTLMVNYSFGDKAITWEHRQWSRRGPEGRNAAVAFHGDQGTLIVDRGGWKVYDHAENLTAESSELAVTHLRNFLDSVKHRTTPVCDLATGVISSGLCHLGNMAYRLGREVQLDPQRLSFGSDTEAAALAQREPRAGWEIAAG